MSAEAMSPAVHRAGPLRRLVANRVSWFALAVIAVLVFVGLFLPALMGNPNFNSISRSILQPPSAEYWLGTDELGRSVLVQMVYGVRTSLVVGLLAAFSATLLGITIGALSGFVGGRTDALLMRVTEMFQVMPTFILASIVVAFAGPSMFNIIVVIAALAWPQAARLMRGEVLKIKSMDFADAARCLGLSETRILVREIIPNAIAPVITVGTLVIGQAILLEAALAFFGLTSADVPSWGRLLTSGQRYFYNAWWLSLFPGLAILFTVLAFNLLGDAINAALNPRTEDR
jgi:peptide/nickel transport system permease protein